MSQPISKVSAGIAWNLSQADVDDTIAPDDFTTASSMPFTKRAFDIVCSLALFPCYKFRTMVPDAQLVLERLLADRPDLRIEWERDFKLKDDPRVTRIGKFLRKYSLDELPQFWNVLRGDMSLVGPRPIIADELKRYGRYADCYLAARPGVTGLWQVSGRSDVDYDHRVRLDREYIERRCVSLDIVIVFRTAWVVLRRKGAY